MRFTMSLALASAIVLAPFALAQDRGTITGTVSDTTGALMPGASVVFTNTATEAKYDTVTSDTGNYTMTALPVGIYSLSVSRAGFSAYRQTGIHVQVAVTTRVDVILQVGTTLTVIVSKPGTIASVKTLKIRSRKAPLLTSRCLPPGATKTVACSAG